VDVLRPDPPKLSEALNRALAKGDRSPAGRNRRPASIYRSLTSGLDGVERIESGAGTGAPKPALMPAGFAGRLEEVARVAAPVAVRLVKCVLGGRGGRSWQGRASRRRSPVRAETRPSDGDFVQSAESEHT
jgi:hypothetical protein